MLIITVAKILGWFLLVAVPYALLTWRGMRRGAQRASSMLVVLACLFAGGAQAGEPAPQDPAAHTRTAVAVGFARSVKIRAAIQAQIAQSDRYALLADAEIPQKAGAVFIGGYGVRAWQEAGRVSCQVQYLVMRQPQHQVLGWGTQRASAPAEAACLELLAARLWTEAEARLQPQVASPAAGLVASARR